MGLQHTSKLCSSSDSTCGSYVQLHLRRCRGCEVGLSNLEGSLVELPSKHWRLLRTSFSPLELSFPVVMPFAANRSGDPDDIPCADKTRRSRDRTSSSCAACVRAILSRRSRTALPSLSFHWTTLGLFVGERAGGASSLDGWSNQLLLGSAAGENIALSMRRRPPRALARRWLAESKLG